MINDYAPNQGCLTFPADGMNSIIQEYFKDCELVVF